MRRASRIDGNQADIVDVLTKGGATVQPLSRFGDGVPDLLVGFLGENHLLEIKTVKPEAKRGARQKRTDDRQKAFREWWEGSGRPVFVIRSAQEAEDWLTQTRVKIWQKGVPVECHG